MELPPLPISAADLLDEEGYTKIFPRRLRPYCIVSVGLKYVEFWQERIANMLFITGIAREPCNTTYIDGAWRDVLMFK